MEDLVAGINLLIAKDASPEVMVQYLQNYKNDDWKKYATWDPYRYQNLPLPNLNPYLDTREI